MRGFQQASIDILIVCRLSFSLSLCHSCSGVCGADLMQSRREFIMTKETALNKRKTLSAQVTFMSGTTVVSCNAALVVAHTAVVWHSPLLLFSCIVRPVSMYPYCRPARRQGSLNTRYSTHARPATLTFSKAKATYDLYCIYISRNVCSVRGIEVVLVDSRLPAHCRVRTRLHIRGISWFL